LTISCQGNILIEAEGMSASVAEEAKLEES